MLDSNPPALKLRRDLAEARCMAIAGGVRRRTSNPPVNSSDIGEQWRATKIRRFIDLR